MNKYLFIDSCQYTPNYNYCLLEAMAKDGNKILFATTESIYDYMPDPPGVAVLKCFFLVSGLINKLINFRKIRRFLRALEYPVDMFFLLCYIIVRKIKVIHFIWIVSPWLDLYIIRLLNHLNCTVIYTAHNSFPHDYAAKQIAAYSRIYHEVDHIIALSDYTKQDIISRTGVEPRKITVIPLGDYTSLFSRYVPNTALASKIKQFAAGKKVISFLGVIRPYKGLDFFIEAIPLIKAEIPDSCFLIAGSPLGVDTIKLLSRIKDLKDKVDLWADIRYLPNSDLMACLSVTDVLVQPYISASQSGNTVMAYAAGVPVVSTNVGGLAEVTEDNETGYVVPPGNPTAIADAVLKCFAGNNYQRLSTNARHVASVKYNWGNIASQMADVYKKLEI